MKTKLMVLMSILMLASYATAYTVDGSLSDWGITPFSDWVPDSPRVDYKVEDYNGTNAEPGPVYPNPYNSEVFDMEALYFDDDAYMAYIASVVSMPPQGAAHEYMGDLALDTNNDGVYEYGIKINGSNKGQVCENPVWHNTSTIKPNSPGYFSCDGITSVVKGTAQVAYVNAGIKDYPAGCTVYTGCNNISCCLSNYIIEVGVPKTWIGLPERGDISNLHITQTCGNDAIDLTVDWDYTLPEFVSAAVPLLVLLLAPGLAFVLVKRKK